MGFEIEEVKSLIVIGGLVPLGYMLGVVMAFCFDSTNEILPGTGALIGTSLAIMITVDRILRIFK